jgi:hypothetical protein
MIRKEITLNDGEKIKIRIVKKNGDYITSVFIYNYENNPHLYYRGDSIEVEDLAD